MLRITSCHLAAIGALMIGLTIAFADVPGRAVGQTESAKVWGSGCVTITPFSQQFCSDICGYVTSGKWMGAGVSDQWTPMCTTVPNCTALRLNGGTCGGT